MPDAFAPEDTARSVDAAPPRAPRAAGSALDPTRGATRRVWPWIAVAALAGIVAYLFFPRPSVGQATTAAAARPAAAGVPVVTASARRGSMGVYLSGLGTVTPLNTVTVHTRVDGELVDVAFTEGQIVQKGDLLARVDPRPFEVQLEQAEGQRAKDAATLENAQLDLKRDQDLYARGIIPKQQLDTQVATVNQAQGAVNSDQGQIDSAKLNLQYSRILSPIAGRVGLRMIDPGNIVHAADASGLVVITQIDPIGVIFTIPEDSLQQLLPRMKSNPHLAVDAYDRDGKAKLASGTLLTVDNEIDQTTGTVKLKTVFSNRGHVLFPNQFVNARLLVDTIKDTVIVPSAAIQRSPQATFVYMVAPDRSVEMRTVQVRLTEGDEAAIAGGLSGGETIVTDGVDKLQQGTKVAPR
jgi:multidrug efflux system membrane fusion protein